MMVTKSQSAQKVLDITDTTLSDSEVNSQVSERLEESAGGPKSKTEVISSHDEIFIPSVYADATLTFMNEYSEQVPPITPQQEKKLKLKLFFGVYSFVFAINLLLYMDKATLSYDSIMGFFGDTGLTQDTYNTVNTLFYVGYALGQFPGQYLAQKLPLRLFLTMLLFIWTVIVFLHCAAFNFSGVAALRFFLGFFESIVMPILMVVMGMFFNATERAAAQPFFFATCMGAPIPTGFIAYGVLYIKDSPIAQWKIFHIIIGGLTFLMTIIVFLFFPNNPAEAKFFSVEEKVWIIRRVQKSTGSSIEQKVFKKHQFREAVRDYITWLFFLFFVLQQIANNLPYQQNLLYEGMGGINNLDSTLVSVAGAGFAVVGSIIASVTLLYIKDVSVFTGLFWWLPVLVGSIAAVSLPWKNKIGILANISMAGQIIGIPFIIALNWSASSTSGYTKRFTRSSISLFGYAIGNIISPQIWREKDAPRYVPAWVIQIVLSCGIAPMIMASIYVILRRRNKNRKINYEKNMENYVQKYHLVETDDGGEIRLPTGGLPGKLSEFNLAVLDLTDWENETYLYPL